MRRASGVGRRSACSPVAFAFAFAFLGALAAPAGCSLVVSTDGLTGGDGGDAISEPDSGTLAFDAGGLALGDGDANAPKGVAPEDAAAPADVHVPADVSVPGDANVASDASADVYVPVDASAADAGQKDAGHDAGLDAGHHEADGGCTGDLSNIGTGDFLVSFELRTTASGQVALVNQRGVCGPATFWDLRLSSGELQMETDDVSSYNAVVGTGPDLNDGAPHTILVERVGGTLTLYADGASRGSGGSSASFGALPALVTGTDVCDGTDGDGTVPFTGTISSLCVAGL